MNDIVTLLSMACSLPCDPRHRATLIEAINTIINLRVENETLKKEISSMLLACDECPNVDGG